jgi:hypothetical protein
MSNPIGHKHQAGQVGEGKRQNVEGGITVTISKMGFIRKSGKEEFGKRIFGG